MRIMDFIAFALDKGCGRRLNELIRGKEQRFIQQESYLANLPTDDLEIAFQAGPLVMGELLRKYPESETLTLAHDRQTDYKSWAEICSLVSATGEELIQAAVEILPDDIKRLAREWRRADMSGQQLIAKQVAEIWRHELQEEIDVVVSPGALEKFEVQTNVDYDASRYLPKQFGDPNCLGREVQLVAFASLCGARFYNALVVRHLASDVRWTELSRHGNLI